MTTRRKTIYSSVVAVALVVLLSIGHAYSDDNDNSNTGAAQRPPLLPPQRSPRQLDDVSDVNGPPASLVDATGDAHRLTSQNASGSPNSTHISIPDLSSYSKTQLYSLLIDVLQKLRVLKQNTDSCHQLQKIVQKILPSDSSSQHSTAGSVEVFLYFKESSLTSQQNSNSAANSNSASRTYVDSGDSKARSGPVAPACVSTPDFIVSVDAQLVRDGVLNDTHERRVDPSPTPGNESRGEGTDRHTGSIDSLESSEEGQQEDKEKFGGKGLSRTQVVVISTCSAIIALFFLVAGFLRVRNYIKRLREEQMLAQRPTFRSCSVRLRSVSQSNDPVRRDSQVSKLSHQSNYNTRSQGYSLTNGSTSRDHSNASSPNHDPDTKPLLVVTAVTEGRSISVSQSSSLQFIDEEPRKKNGERSPPGPDGADEYRPLLGSDNSANSLLVSPSSPTGTSFSNGHANGRLPCARPSGYLPSDVGVETYFQRVSDSPSPKNGRSGVLETTFAHPPPRQQQQSPPRRGEMDVKLPSKTNGVVEVPNRANGVVEIPEQPNGIVEIPDQPNGVVEIPNKTNGVVEIPLIRFCGLTQSDSSLTSMDGNRNYNYGSQTEYTPPCIGYFAGPDYINGLNSQYALAFMAHPYGAFRSAQNVQYVAPKDRSYLPPCCSRANYREQAMGNDVAGSDVADRQGFHQERIASVDSGVEVPLTYPLQRHGSENGGSGSQSQNRHSDDDTQRHRGSNSPGSPPLSAHAGHKPQSHPGDVLSSLNSLPRLDSLAATSPERAGSHSPVDNSQSPVHLSNSVEDRYTESSPCAEPVGQSVGDSDVVQQDRNGAEVAGYTETDFSGPVSSEENFTAEKPACRTVQESSQCDTEGHDSNISQSGDGSYSTDASSVAPPAVDKKEETDTALSSAVLPSDGLAQSNANCTNLPETAVLKAILSVDDERTTFL